ncbi:MAG: DMT family transporter [Acidobacteria bacterium]|nr:DMT family transporter [Acidobacteriota bacterium]
MTPLAERSANSRICSGAAKPRNSWRGILSIAAAALFWGLSASLGRAAFTGRLLPDAGIGRVDPLILSQCRATFSCAVVAIVLLIARGSKVLRVGWPDFRKLFMLGLGGVVASNYFYYLAVQRTTVGTAIILQYTAPVWVFLYMATRGRERFSLPKAGSVLLAVTGIALVIGVVGRGKMALDPVGVTAALIAALSFSYYNIGGHDLVRRYDRWMVLFYTTLAASLFWIALNPPNRIFSAHYSSATWLFLAAFSFVSVLLPYTFYFAGLERLEPTRAVIASCLEPVFTILIAAITLKEGVGGVEGLGIVMVLAAILLAETRGHQTRPMAAPLE